MKKTKKVEVEERFCDVCGKKIPDDVSNGYLVVHGPYPECEVLYESAIYGDYCHEHSERLMYAMIQNIGCHGRYDTVKPEDAVSSEVALIKAYEEKRGIGGDY